LARALPRGALPNLIASGAPHLAIASGGAAIAKLWGGEHRPTGLGAGETFWADDSLAAARALNAELLADTGWLGSVLPVGDGVALATRRG